MLYTFPTLGGLRTIEWDGADRSVNKDATKNGILTKISYPTGGYSVFEYESNTYGFGKQTLINQPDTSYSKNEGVVISNGVDVSGKRFREKNISLSTQQFVKIQYSRFCIKRVFNELMEPEGIVKIVNLSTNEVVFEGIENVNNLIKIITLNAGNYKLYVEVTNAGDHSSLSINYEPSVITLKSLLTGGLRIKKITDADGLGNKNEKEYSYNMENETDRSSGVLVRNPKYDYKFTKNVINQNYLTLCSYIVRTANSQLPLVTNAGYHVAYRQVTIIEKGTKNNGKTITTFVSPFEFSDGGGEGFPFAPPTSYEHKRGNIAKEVSYRFDTNLAQYLLIREKTYKYKYGINTKKVNGMKMGILADNSTQSGIDGQVITQIQHRILKSLYQYISEFMYLESTTEKMYSQTDNSAYISNTNITDYSSKHYQPIKITQQDSKGRENTRYFRYVMDYELCANTCETIYNAAIDNCYNQFYPCAQEKVNTCASFVSGCQQTAYNNCMASYCCPNPTNTSCEVFSPRSCENVSTDCMVKAGITCTTAYESCVSTGYIQCQIPNIQCQDAAIAQYNTCKTDYLNCLIANRNNAQDKQTAAILQMQLNNQVSIPIEQWTTIKGTDGIEKVTSAMLYEYEKHPQNGNLVVQKGIKVLEINEPLTNFKFSKIENLVFIPHQTDIEGNGYVKRINFDTFDEKGNLLQQNKIDDISQAYIWGYNKTMPIAQVIHANKDEIFYTSFEEATTGGNIIDNEAQAKTGNKYFNGTYQVPNIMAVASKKYTLTYFQFENNEWKYKKTDYVANTSLTGMIDEVRIYPEGALMTTLTYTPLIGKTSETDTNGITTYYEYDSANRLKFIKDQDKNIIQRFTYKYAE